MILLVIGFHTAKKPGKTNQTPIAAAQRKKGAGVHLSTYPVSVNTSGR